MVVYVDIYDRRNAVDENENVVYDLVVENGIDDNDDDDVDDDKNDGGDSFD